jgi:hypothetical protein
VFFFISLFIFFISAEPSKMIGSAALQQKFENRLYSSSFTLAELYGFQTPPSSFPQQLGFYQTGSYQIKNGEPNSFNMILLSYLMDQIAQDLSQACANPKPQSHLPTLRLSLQKSLQNFCHWPAPLSLEEKNFDQLLSLITNFDLPLQEQQIWKKHFQSPQHFNKQPQQIIYEMTYTLLMNPYFLLKR